MKTKREQVIEKLNNEDYIGALKIAKCFNRDFNKEQSSIIKRAYEMQSNGSFYEQLGFNKNEQLEKAKQILVNTYL